MEEYIEYKENELEQLTQNQNQNTMQPPATNKIVGEVKSTLYLNNYIFYIFLFNQSRWTKSLTFCHSNPTTRTSCRMQLSSCSVSKDWSGIQYNHDHSNSSLILYLLNLFIFIFIIFIYIYYLINIQHHIIRYICLYI